MDIPRIVAYVQSGDADPTQNHYIPLVNKTGQTNKSLIKLNNKPMIQYVLEAIDGCPYISDIVISGIQPKDIESKFPGVFQYHLYGDYYESQTLLKGYHLALNQDLENY